MEQFDVLDCAGVKTGGLIDRDKAHTTGAWHGAFHCQIAYPRDGRVMTLFQLRSRAKKIASGKYDVSVGGHYSAGEGPETAGPREIEEELGLRVSYASIVPLGKRVFVCCFAPGVREFEFQDIFLLPLDGPPHEVVLQRSEVDAVLEMDVEQGVRFFQGDIAALDCALTRSDGGRERVTVRSDEFVRCHDRYYLKLLQLVRRYYGGDRRGLAI